MVENIAKNIIQDDAHVDSGDIANMFNDHFVDIGINMAQSIGRNNVNHLDYLTYKPTKFFSFRRIDCYSTEKNNFLSDK